VPVEFLGIAATNNGSETTARTGPIFDKEYTLRLAQAHEENGWDRVLFAYGSNAPDPNIGAAYIASKTFAGSTVKDAAAAIESAR
jgi:alkanesulfonate monooxygenase